MRLATFSLLLFCAIASGARAEVPELRARIGQMILLGFLGADARDGWMPQVLEQLEQGRIGGVLFLKGNIASRRAVLRMNRAIARAARNGPPPLIAIDQEGGRVERLTRRVGFTELPSASQIARRHEPARARQRYADMAGQLRQWGFNLNLGPVVDLNVNPANPVIGRPGRAYSADPDTVARYAAAFVEAHREHGMLTALKHFPGHGSSTADSHDTLPDISATWSRTELKPYRILIRDKQADMIMTGHLVNAQLQPAGKVPATMSQAVIEGVLRGELGYDGVVISDDLQMDGVADRFDLKARVLGAVNAGTDILIFANDRHPDRHIVEKVTDILAEAATQDEALAARIERSWRRIVALKERLGAGISGAGE